MPSGHNLAPFAGATMVRQRQRSSPISHLACLLRIWPLLAGLVTGSAPSPVVGRRRPPRCLPAPTATGRAARRRASAGRRHQRRERSPAATERASTGHANDGPLIIGEAKSKLARTLGVNPASIKITGRGVMRTRWAPSSGSIVCARRCGRCQKTASPPQSSIRDEPLRMLPVDATDTVGAKKPAHCVLDPPQTACPQVFNSPARYRA